MPMNHCEVARKTVGVLCRQQCGYECLKGEDWNNPPAASIALTISGCAFQMFMPPNNARVDAY